MSARRLLQVVVAAGGLVPVAAGAAGVLLGPRFAGAPFAGTPDLDSHFRYLSGLLLGIGLAFWSTVPAIERRTGRFRLLAALVACGGLGRLLSLLAQGRPSGGHLFGLVMELGVTPLLVLWQARVARERRPS